MSLLSVLLLLLLNEVLAERFSITCGSEFVPPGHSFCPGVPVICTVQLNSSCTEDVNISVLIVDWNDNYVMPEFTINQTGLNLDIETDFLISESDKELSIQVVSTDVDCEFSVTSTGDTTTIENCLYPLSLSSFVVDPSHITSLKGGSTLSVMLEIDSGLSNVGNLSVALGPAHPALQVLSYVTQTVPFILASPTSNVQSLPTHVVPFVTVSEYPASSSLVMNVTLLVSQFVLPDSILYFSFCTYYHHSAYSLMTVEQCTGQIRDYVVASPFVGEWTFSLPFYDDVDRLENTFAPHEGDIFVISVPIFLPCVSTSLNISVVVPEYWSEVYTYFFTNVTSVNISTPSNLLSVPQPCNYTDPQLFAQNGCTLDGAVPPSETTSLKEAAGPGNDIVLVELGALVYNLSSGIECVDEVNCSCSDEEILLTISGHVVTDMVCENQTLADNVIVKLNYVADSISWLDSDILPSIEQLNTLKSALFPVNASMPAIDLPISSHSGDAGDSFYVTFGVVHNREYSSFTAYGLNYTFSIIPYLNPSENISVCFFNASDNPVLCESVPFEKYTISRFGYHEVFTLNIDRVELTLEVTVVQEVAPGISFCNPGNTTFQSLPDVNVLHLVPLVCSNSSCGGVQIHPVYLHPWFVHWSDVDATHTESPASVHYVTVHEEFNMTILACMPESFTGVEHITLLPSSSDSPLVTVNNAYVTYIGSELYNTTLSVGDNISVSPNISLNGASTGVSFFFGSEVLVPKDNVVVSNEQCFEIGLHCTVDDVTSLVDGARISYNSYVQTDFDIQSNFQSITLAIAEPDLITLPIPLTMRYDAGDVATVVIRLLHARSSLHTNAFRLNLTVTYSSEYFYLNTSDPDSVIFLLEGSTRLYTIDADIEGEILFSADELVTGQVLEAKMYFKLTNSVESTTNYVIPHYVEWHNLPYELTRSGRDYSTSGVHTLSTKGPLLSISYTTSDIHTPNENIQIGEFVYMNVTVILPEGVSSLTVRVSHVNIQPGDYPLNITHGEVIYTGNSLSNLSLSVNDTIDTSVNIQQSGHSDVTFSFGSEVLNRYDNDVDQGDEVIVYIEAYISSLDGNGIANQGIVGEGVILEEPLVRDTVELALAHPQLEISSLGVSPVGPWDGGDVIEITTTISFVNPSDAFVAYDVVLSMSLNEDLFPHNFTLLNSSDGNPSCTSEEVSFTVVHVSHTEVMLTPFIASCVASVRLTVQFSDELVISGDEVTVTGNLNEYFGSPPLSSVPRLKYGPEEPNTCLGNFKEIEQTLQTNVTTPTLFVAPEDVLQFVSTVVVPEGYTLNVSVEHYITTMAPSEIDLEVNVQMVEIYPTSESMTLPNLGDIFNPSDNTLNVNDTCIFTLTVAVPSNSSGTTFTFFVVSHYTTSHSQRELMNSVSIGVIRPDLDTFATVSQRVVYYGDVIYFTATVSRDDESFPVYDIHANLSVFLCPIDILNISVEGPSAVADFMLFNLGTLSYVEATDSSVLQFEGTIGSNLTDGDTIELSALLEYSADPTNGRVYIETFTFPTLYFVEPIVSGKVEFAYYDEETNGGTLRLTLAGVAGAPDNMLVDIILNERILQLISVEVNSIGSGLVYSAPPLISTSGTQSNVTLSNLTVKVTDSGICLECDRDIVIVVNVTFMEKISGCNNLLNATVFYSVVHRVFVAECTALSAVLVTSNPVTLANTVQVSEELQLNITLVPAELSCTSLALSLIVNQTLPDKYALVIENVVVLTVGESLRNVSLSVGDNATSADGINILSPVEAELMFGNVCNIPDDLVDGGHEIMVQFDLYVSSVGSGNEEQDIAIAYYLQNEEVIGSTIGLQLTHPQLQIDAFVIESLGPWDGGDYINMTIAVVHSNMNAFAAYGLSIYVGLQDSNFTSSLRVLNDSFITGNESCSETSDSFSVIDASRVAVSKLPVNCTAVLHIEAQLADSAVRAGSNITVSATVESYYSGATLDGEYGPTESLNATGYFKEPFQILQTNVSGSQFVAPAATIQVTSTVTFPEGYTSNVSVDSSVTGSPSPRVDDLEVTLTSTRIHPLSEFMTPPYLGDIFNPSDNVDTINDTATFQWSILIPTNSSLEVFTFRVVTSFDSPLGRTDLEESLEFFIVYPDVEVVTNVSQRIAYSWNTLTFAILFSRVDRTAPVYDVPYNVTLPHLPADTLNITVPTESMAALQGTLSYVIDTDVVILEFRGTVGSNVSDGQSLQVPPALFEYSSEPTNGEEYSQTIHFPEVFVFKPMLQEAYFEFQSVTVSENETEIGSWILSVTGIAGPPSDLVVEFGVISDVLRISSVEVISIGSGLDVRESPLITTGDFSALVVFPRLTLSVSEDGVCTECSRDILIRIESEFANSVGENSQLMSANITYSTEQIMSTAQSTLVLTSWSTSNPDTLGDYLQVNEQLFLNITVIPPEGTNMSLALKLTTNQTSAINYPLTIRNARVVYVGGSLQNVSLQPGDTDLNIETIDITSTTHAEFSFGDVYNRPDNIADSEDELVLQVEVYVSALGTGAEQQSLFLSYYLEDEPYVRGLIPLELVHPQIQMAVENVTSGPWDADDRIEFLISLEHIDANATAYDLGFNISMENGLLRDLELLSSISSGSDCTAPSIVCSVTDLQLTCPLFPSGCTALLALSTRLPLTVVIGDNITIDVTLGQYYSSTGLPPFARKLYIPVKVNITEESSTILHTIVISPSFPTVTEPFTVTISILLPEGLTQNFSLATSVVWNTTETFPLNLTLEGVQLGSSINVSTEDLLFLYPVFQFGDVFNLADNLQTSTSDTINMTLSGQVPLEAFRSAFTIAITTTYSGISEPSLTQYSTSAAAPVIGGPMLQYQYSVSSRLVIIGEPLVYTLSIEYIPSDLLPDSVASVTISLTYPSFVEAVNDSLSIRDSLRQRDTDCHGICYVTTTLNQESLSRINSTLEIEIPVVILGGSNGTVVDAVASVDYSFTEFSSIRLFTDSVPFPLVYLSQLDLEFYLNSSSDPRTEGGLLTFREIGIWRIEMTNVIGPTANLELSVQAEDYQLVVMDVDIVEIRFNLTFDGSPVIDVTNHSAMVTFVNLTVVNPADVDDCNSCDVFIDVRYSLATVETRNLATKLHANVTYGTLNVQKEASVVLTPPTDLTLSLHGPNQTLEVGSEYSLNVTVQHNSSESLDAYDISVGFDESSHVNIHTTFVVGIFESSNITIFESDFVDGGIPVLYSNQSLQLHFTFTLNPRTRPHSAIRIQFSLTYSNTGDGSSFSETLKDELVFFTTQFPPALSQLSATSSEYTPQDQFAINEVIQLEVRSFIPHGLVDVEYHTVLKAPLGTQLPVEILDTYELVPVGFELGGRWNNSSNSTIISLYSPSELHLVWSVGTIYNPPDGVRNDSDLIVLMYTLAITQTNVSNLPLEIATFAFTSSEAVPFPEIEGRVVQPELHVVKANRILEERTMQLVEFTTVLSHGNYSTGAAFDVVLVEYVPLALHVQLPLNISVSPNLNAGEVESEVTDGDDGTSLRVFLPVFTTDSEVRLTYKAQLDTFFPSGQNLTTPVDVNYSSINQEGIGLRYPQLRGAQYAVAGLSCIEKETVLVYSKVDNVWGIVICIFFGISVGCGITVFTLLICYYRRMRKSKLKVVPTLVTAAIFRRSSNNDHYLFGSKNSRPLVSSLLVALQEPQWYLRVDTYEHSEAEYAAEVEGDMFQLEMEMIRMIVGCVLEMLSLSKERIINLNSACDEKITRLKASLKESLSEDVEDMELKFGADKLLEEEDVRLAQDMEVEEFREYLLLDIDVAANLLDLMDEQNRLEKKLVLSVVEMRKKEREKQIILQYMLHYSLGLKALAATILKKASGNAKPMNVFLEKLNEVANVISTLKNEIEEAVVSRQKRQKRVLLEKSLFEEEDRQWKEFMVKQVTAVHTLADAQKMNKNFVSKIDALGSQLRQKELSIVQAALRKLAVLEEQLGHPSYTIPDNMTSIEAATKTWIQLQATREQALEDLEQQVASELRECWNLHLRNRTKLLDEQTSQLSLHLTAKGMQLQQCDEIMQQHALSRVNLNESLQANSLVKKAKLQALLDNQSEQLRTNKKAQNEKLLSMKNEIEIAFLKQFMSSLSMEEIFEEYHRRVVRFQPSMSLDRFSIIVRMKGRHQQKKKRKLDVNQHKYFRQLQQKMNSGVTDGKMAQGFLEMRGAIIMDSYPAMVDNVRRRVEEEFCSEKDHVLLQASTTMQMVSESQGGSEEMSPSSTCRIPQLQVTLVDQGDFNNEAQKLLSSYEEDVLKVDEQLNVEQRRSASELNRRIREKRISRAKSPSRSETTLEPLIPGFKFSKLREIVIRQRYAMKLEETQKEHMKNLRQSLEELQSEYNLKRQEAISKLESKFVRYITKVGTLSEDQLVDIFKDIDQWHSGEPRKKTQKRRLSSLTATRPRLQSDDPLLTNRMRSDELPPLSFLSTRRGTIT